MTLTPDAVGLLQADYRELKGLFDSFGQLCHRNAGRIVIEASA